jgi:hypothetical protein
MAGKLKEVKILGYDILFIFRHRYEKDDDGNKLLESFTMWSEWRLGFFFKLDKAVGKKNFNKPKEWGSNLVNHVMIGIDLLWCKAWVTISKGSMKLKID